MQYNAFISYSHAADGQLAPAIGSMLHRLARPWYRMRALHVFRDRTNLTVSPELWPEIEVALGESEFFILLASPAAATSKWVRKEVDHWLGKRDLKKLLIAVTDGEIVWDDQAGDFDWTRTNVLPENLRGRFTQEPLFVDFRWTKSSDWSQRHEKFIDCVATIAGRLHGKSKEEIKNKDREEHRKILRTAVAAARDARHLGVDSNCSLLDLGHLHKRRESRVPDL